MVRPRKLHRQNIIDIAVIEYWINGINNVPISKIAKIADVSRPGIYIEFKSEELLKASALEHYIQFWDNSILKNYNDFKRHPQNLLTHFKTVINITSFTKYVDAISSYKFTEKSKGIKGCLLRNSALILNQLSPVLQKIIKKHDDYRITLFEKHIFNLQNEKIFNKKMNVNNYAKFINLQFEVIQMMINKGNPKREIIRYINTALIPLVNKDKIDEFKIH